MIYLLDTNILSEPLKSHPHPGVMERLRELSDVAATASVVWHELLYGMERMPLSRKRDAVSAYLKRMGSTRLPILPYDNAAAAWHGGERARLERTGRTPPFADGQIAAIAKVHGLILVSRNAQDFRYFANLQVEDWWSD